MVSILRHIILVVVLEVLVIAIYIYIYIYIYRIISKFKQLFGRQYPFQTILKTITLIAIISHSSHIPAPY